jgi:hypothetical protein
MEPQNNKAMSQYLFLESEDAEHVFSDVDYHLKNGTHIQDRKSQYKLYKFIEGNLGELSTYYLALFKLHLRSSGIEPDKYFYLEFPPEVRVGVPLEFRVHLKPEHVIIAFLLYKVIYIDRNIELNSVTEFQRLLRNDYEDIKPDLFRLFAKVKELKSSEMNDDKVDRIIVKAMYEFNTLGWLQLEDDHFDIWPAFQRIYLLYSDQIDTLYEQLKDKK